MTHATGTANPVFQETPSISIASVQVKGLQHTRESLLAPLLTPILSANTLDALLQTSQHSCHQLDKLGIFKSISIDLDYQTSSVAPATEEEAPLGGQGIHVVLNVQEKPRYTASANTGFRGHEGFMVLPPLFF